MTVFGGMAEFERSLIVERTSSGRAAAKARGTKFGRKRTLTPAQLDLSIVSPTRATRCGHQGERAILGAGVTDRFFDCQGTLPFLRGAHLLRQTRVQVLNDDLLKIVGR